MDKQDGTLCVVSHAAHLPLLNAQRQTDEQSPFGRLPKDATIRVDSRTETVGLDIPLQPVDSVTREKVYAPRSAGGNENSLSPERPEFPFAQGGQQAEREGHRVTDKGRREYFLEGGADLEAVNRTLAVLGEAPLNDSLVIGTDDLQLLINDARAGKKPPPVEVLSLEDLNLQPHQPMHPVLLGRK